MVLMVVVGANVTEINDYNNMTTIVTEVCLKAISSNFVGFNIFIESKTYRTLSA